MTRSGIRKERSFLSSAKDVLMISGSLTEADLPDIGLDIEDRPVGGLGIFLIREMMDSMSYEYKDGCNVLKLTRLNG